MKMKAIRTYVTRLANEFWAIFRHVGTLGYLLTIVPLLGFGRCFMLFMRRVAHEMYRRRTPIPPWKRQAAAPSRVADAVMIAIVIGLGIASVF